MTLTSPTARTQERVLVAGATGGVGQLTVAKLLEKGFPVRVLTRNAEKARTMFDNRVEIAIVETFKVRVFFYCYG